ncbi:unnamed protein product [Paramecium sonneborni]|uniref:RING-type domain-containing protein n=1 Tax=Paramecium sonneborni TaxID=65129 RepID=A0A8S1R1Q4_9CILI|nr:unnamed protein product [Paramecium sonneborni]
MQFLSIRLQIGLSHRQLKIFDFSILGLATFTFYGLYKLILKRKELKQKLKQFRYLYTPEECQQLKIDKKEILIQGQINTDNQFLHLMSSNQLNKSKILKNQFDKKVYFFQITNPSTNTDISGRLNTNCKFENELINYHQQWKYKTEISPTTNIIVRTLRKIKNYFFGKIFVENLTGIDQNQYFVFKGTLEKKLNKLEFWINHIAKTPSIFYNQIMKELKKNYFQIFLLSISATFLMIICYCRVISFFQKEIKEKELFNKKENEVVAESDLCIICQTTVRNVLTLPCFHLVCCQDCLDKMQQKSNLCPICRTQISQQIQLLIDNIN